MNDFLQFIGRKNVLLFGLAGLGPLLLLSNRLLYSVSMSLMLLLLGALLYASSFLVETLMDRKFWYSSRLLLGSVYTAIIDMLFTAYFPLIREDMGILLPMALFSGVLISLVDRGVSSDQADDDSGNAMTAGEFFGSIAGFLLVFNGLAVVRELLAFGGISMRITPWKESAHQPTALLLFSTVFGLLLLLGLLRAVFHRGKE